MTDLQSGDQPLLRLEGVSKRFGENEVLHALSLSVGAGEFLTLLGPSGCGKTTTLRIIAGLEQPTGGKVYLGGQDVTELPPEKRGVNTVFQNYALFPHMNVFQNIAYGLRLQRVSKEEIKRRVGEMLKMVQLEGYGKRMPTQLSGGQRQRVAIARALVLSPKVLLLDEPLGALDLKLRQQMQMELKRLQQTLGITFIYVTHDQEEALNMSTRIVVMNAGHVEQVGTPEEVYERPATLFCAGFVGQSNLLYGRVSGKNEAGEYVLDVDGLNVPALDVAGIEPKLGDRVALCLRTQRVHYGAEPRGSIRLSGVIESKEYAGGLQRTRIQISDSLCLSTVSQTSELDSFAIGARVFVWWNVRHAAMVPDHGEDEA